MCGLAQPLMQLRLADQRGQRIRVEVDRRRQRGAFVARIALLAIGARQVEPQHRRLRVGKRRAAQQRNRLVDLAAIQQQQPEPVERRRVGCVDSDDRAVMPDRRRRLTGRIRRRRKFPCDATVIHAAPWTGHDKAARYLVGVRCGTTKRPETRPPVAGLPGVPPRDDPSSVERPLSRSIARRWPRSCESP